MWVGGKTRLTFFSSVMRAIVNPVCGFFHDFSKDDTKRALSEESSRNRRPFDTTLLVLGNRCSKCLNGDCGFWLKSAKIWDCSAVHIPNHQISDACEKILAYVFWLPISDYHVVRLIWRQGPNRVKNWIEDLEGKAGLSTVKPRKLKRLKTKISVLLRVEIRAEGTKKRFRSRDLRSCG